MNPYLIFSGTPVVSECEGMYEIDNRKNKLLWNLPVINTSNKSGSMEFSCNGKPSDFFPVTVHFECSQSYCSFKVWYICFYISQKIVCRIDMYEL